MTLLIEVLALVTAVANIVAAAIGAWRWWTVGASPVFWVACRVGQAVAVAQAIGAGVAALVGHEPDDGLYWLYALLPVAVSYVAEQLRMLAAQSVLEARGMEDAKAVGELPEREQRSIVLAIVRREIGTMAVAAVVVAVLALRAYGSA